MKCKNSKYSRKHKYCNKYKNETKRIFGHLEGFVLVWRKWQRSCSGRFNNNLLKITVLLNIPLVNNWYFKHCSDFSCSDSQSFKTSPTGFVTKDKISNKHNVNRCSNLTRHRNHPAEPPAPAGLKLSRDTSSRDLLLEDSELIRSHRWLTQHQKHLRRLPEDFLILAGNSGWLVTATVSTVSHNSALCGLEAWRLRLPPGSGVQRPREGGGVS